MLAAATSASSKLAHGSREKQPSLSDRWGQQSGSQSKFHELLKQLAEEHDREIQELADRKRKKEYANKPPEPPQSQQRFVSVLSQSTEKGDTDFGGLEAVQEAPEAPEKSLEPVAAQAPAELLDTSNRVEQGQSRPQAKVTFDSAAGEEGGDKKNRMGLVNWSRHESQTLRAVWSQPPGQTESQLECQQQPQSAMQSQHAPHGNLETARDKMKSAAAELAPAKACYISYPNSKFRLFWDIAGMVFIAVDFIMIPFSAFEPPETEGMVVVAWIILLFWSLDIVATFLVGYVERGHIIVEPRRIFNHYVRTWFFVDLLVVIPDWLVTLVLGRNRDDAKPGGATRLIRILRIARVLRLLRLMKLGRILATVEDRIDSEYVFVVMEIFKLIVFVIMTSHVLACAMYAIGTAHDGDDTWRLDFEGHSLEYKYFTSLHWSLAKVALESMDIEAQNTRERVFTVSILTLGLFVFSSVVSRITMSMLQMQELGREQGKQFWLLRRYLGERSVPSALGARIQRFVEHEVERQQYYIPEENVKLLGLLSKHLGGELQSSISMTILGVHLYIKKLSEMSEVTVFRICDKAITRTHAARGDSLFFRGEEAFIMYFVVTGVVRYSQCTNEAELYMPDSDCVRVSKKGYLCEPVIWCNWVYRGFAASETQSELLELDANVFATVVQSQPLMHAKTQRYAAQFHEALKAVSLQEYNDTIDCNFLGLKNYLTTDFDEDLQRGRFATGVRAARKTMAQTRFGNSSRQRSKTSGISKGFERESHSSGPQEHTPILPDFAKPPPTNLDMQIIDQIDSIDISQPNYVGASDLEEAEVVNLPPRLGFEASERSARHDHLSVHSVDTLEPKNTSSIVRPFKSDEDL